MNITIRNIVKLFEKQKVLDNVCFTINEGELVGFLGPNGAGKSTLMKILTGYLPADSGEVRIGGRQIEINNVEIKKNIGYLPEHNPLYSDLYVKEHLALAAGLYKLPDKDQKIKKIIELTGLGGEEHKKIGMLSKGFRQRVGLAQALIHDPPVLILDEPTTGLDPNQLQEIRGLIKKISLKKTVILSTHIMQEVEAVCNRAVIINKGKLIADGSIAELKSGRFNANQTVIAGFNKNIDLNQLLALEGIKNAYLSDGLWNIESDGKIDIREVIFNFAVKNGLILLTLVEKQQNLESIFQRLTLNSH
jgi:ABC-2 type transport system ATP-binding protein